MNKGKKINISDLKVAAFLLAIFWTVALLLWRSTGKIFYLFNFGYIGSSLGIGIGVYSVLPRKKKLWGRRLAQFLVGAYMLVFVGLYNHENMQIEGFFFYLLAGIFAGSTLHYLIAKVVGPLFFNRGWCGWACWTAMILDLLPYRRNKDGRLPARWGRLRVLHFGLSLALVLALWFGLGYSIQKKSIHEVYWLIAGNLLYYGIGISLAFILRDNRAFCKYVCPIPTLQKLPSRFALLKVKGKEEGCIECGACSRACPMDILVMDYVQNNQRITSTECILCMECIDVCPQDVLDVTFAVDTRFVERLNTRA